MPISRYHNRPIGVFDSGLGGLTVFKELMRQLPHEDIIYFGDTARVPYGTKSKEAIIRFSKQNVSILMKYKVKMVVVACNSSSSFALPVLRESFKIPIIGVIEPGAKKAVGTTTNNVIGVIATTATITSGSYTKKIKQLNSKAKVLTQACPLFVPLVEEGLFVHKPTELIAKQYLNKIKQSKVDTLILGCTHYPLLKSIIQKVVGKNVTLIDSAKEVAKDVKELLLKSRYIQIKKRQAKYLFLVSDQPKHFQQLAKLFLGGGITNVKRYSDV